MEKNGYSNIVTRGGSGTLTHCACQNSRFDLDSFERLIIPDAIAGVMNIADAAGNRIGRWGKRGKDLSKMKFLWPSTVVGSDDYIFVQDYRHCKSVRLKQEYFETKKVKFSFD